MVKKKLEKLEIELEEGMTRQFWFMVFGKI